MKVKFLPHLWLFALAFCLPNSIYAQQNESLKSQTEASVQPVLPESVSDGCTMWFDADYRDCCIQHDSEYRKPGGGGWRARLRSDNRLFLCVARKKGDWHKPDALVMWMGVRIFGSDMLPFSSKNSVHRFIKNMFR